MEEVATRDNDEWITETPEPITRNKPKKLPRFELGDRVKFSKTVDNPYMSINKKTYRRLIHDTEEARNGIVIGVSFLCEGKYVPSTGSGYWNVLAEPAFLIIEKRHMVYLVKTELRGCTYKVLPEDLEQVGGAVGSQ